METTAAGIAALWLMGVAPAFVQAPTMKLAEVLVFTLSPEKPAAD